MEIVGNSSLKFIRVKEGDKVESFMIHIIMTEGIIKIDIDQIEEMEELNLVDKVELKPRY